jgi:hypothetical protein
MCPKRRDTLLVEGSMLLTARDGDLVQVEGFLVKSGHATLISCGGTRALTVCVSLRPCNPPPVS